jgi:ABC-type Fe3+/spermidine/putrescine transport system ATPase subunit
VTAQGPSGSGKTTLLRLLAGQIQQGKVIIVVTFNAMSSVAFVGGWH